MAVIVGSRSKVLAVRGLREIAHFLLASFHLANDVILDTHIMINDACIRRTTGKSVIIPRKSTNS